MSGFRQVQEALDRILGEAPPPNHGVFWRGKTRDEFISATVFGLPVLVVGDPERSNLVRALRGLPPFGLDVTPRPAGARMRRMPAGLPPAAESDIAIIEGWIRQGCPEEAPQAEVMMISARLPTDDTHVKFWRAFDNFFLPGLSSEETLRHVGPMHMPALEAWIGQAIFGDPPDGWLSYLSENRESFEYVRHHHHRLIREYYGSSQQNLFDSMWKFGGNLLPVDPQSRARPTHTMNGIPDWFNWLPYMDGSLRAPDRSDADLALARAWNVGIVADGLLRTDSERPAEMRMPITDFRANDPDLQANVYRTYASAAVPDLVQAMLKRTTESGLFSR